MMKCHYEVLGVSRDASDDDLKRAYRRLALKWHPDKNPENASEAKEQFQLIQRAYDVLSDAHERTWYDEHREAILKGGLGGDFEDDSINLFEYFASTCYKSYDDDDPKGFYNVYRSVFEKIAAEDAEFGAEPMDTDDEPPNFGDSLSSYEDTVHQFYAYWQSYSTRRTYAWLEIYDTRNAPNRRTQRLAEKENRKIRDRAKRERNEQVRNLVAYVRKRDKRVKANAERMAERARANAQKAEELKRAKLLERQRELKEHRVSDWSKFSNLEAELRNVEASLLAEFGERPSGDEDNEDDAESMDALYCVACNKIFKTRKAFANHENSKRHRDNLETLRKTMAHEDGMENDRESDEEVTASRDTDDILDSDYLASGMDSKLGSDAKQSGIDPPKDSDENHDLTLKGQVKVKSKKGSEARGGPTEIITARSELCSEQNLKLDGLENTHGGATGPEMPDFLLEPVTRNATVEDGTSEGELYSGEDDDTDESEDESHYNKNRKDEDPKVKVAQTSDLISKPAPKASTSPLDDYVFPEGSTVNTNENAIEASPEELVSDQEEEEEEEEKERSAQKKKKKKMQRKSKVNLKISPESEEENDCLGLSKKQRKMRRNLEERIARKENNDLDEPKVTEDARPTEAIEEPNSDDTSGISKTRGKRAKEMRKAQKQGRVKVETSKGPRTKRHSKTLDLENVDHTCVTCHLEFSSKTKLFDHLKKTGHSVPLPGTKTKRIKEKNKSRGRVRAESESS